MSKFYLGRNKDVSYNTRTGRVSGGDAYFLVLTLSLILVPSLGCLVCAIWLNANLELWLQILLTVILSLSVFMCLRSLLKCAFTDPGIIPSLTKA